MRARAGFTLLELLVAIVLVGVVALLVYGVAGVAADTQQRLVDKQRVLQSENAMRATIHDALRNARPARRRGDTAFFLENRYDADGRPLDRLSFVTAGGLPPLTADADWAVTLEPSSSGLVMVATAVGVVAPPRVVVGLPGITGLDVQVQEMTHERGWSDRWRFPALVPRALALTYWTDDAPAGPTVVLALPLGGVQ